MHKLSPALLAALLFAALFATSPAFAMRAVDFAEYRLPESGAIAIPVTATEVLSGVAAAVDEATGGSLAAALGDRFAPAPLLEELAESGRTFYEAFGGA